MNDDMVNPRYREEAPIDLTKAPDPGDIDALLAGDRVGEYILEEVIGEGGCGRVWKARHAVLPGVIVAVKLPRDPALIDMLRRESLLQHGLEHPGVLKVHGIDLDAPIPYLVQEYAPGGDLSRLLEREGKLPLKRAMGLFFEIIDILVFAHERGVVHRDLKPGNILLNAEGRVRIGDFGLGRGVEALSGTALVESIQSIANHSGGWIGGTWEYMAPEQKQKDAKRREQASDPSVDIFALGIILYEMLMGERPAGRVSLETISPGLDSIFARCWTTRELRFADAGALSAALSDMRTHPGRLSRGKKRVKPAGGSTSIGLARIFWMYLVPLALLGGALGLLWHNEKRPGIVLPRHTFPEESRDEAGELALLRQRIESNPTTIQDARGEFAEFRARSKDPRLAALAQRWESLLPATGMTAEYSVRLVRFNIHREAYRRAVYSALEPGRPDVYIRVYSGDGKKEDRIYDSKSHPIESWSFDWSETPNYPSFKLKWKPGNRVRVEMWDRDTFGDNLIAKYELSGELSILLFSSPRQSAEGHAVEFISDFAFGK